MKNIDERIDIFRELLSSVNNICITEFDMDYKVVNSNSPYLEMFYLLLMCEQTFLDNLMLLEKEKKLVGSEIDIKPAIFTNAMGITWISEIFMREEKINRIYMLGPVFLDGYSVNLIDNQVNRFNPSIVTKHRFMETIKEIPVIDLSRFYEYGIMLHCCLTGEKITLDDFLYPDLDENLPENGNLQEYQGMYMVENEILKLVEEGNMRYETEMERFISFGKIGKMADSDYLRQIKNIVIIFCALCSRAAVKGGLSTEISYQLREVYIRKVEQADTLSKVNEVNRSMLEDYVLRVHQGKMLSGELSPQVKESCDYIDLHLRDRADIHYLASRLGYTDYYFSNKFKKETGLNIRDFINKKKIEVAKEMLANSHMQIQEVCIELGFNSQSYFGKIFRKEVGMSPGEFRTISNTKIN